MTKFSRYADKSKPSKPYPEIPLLPHAGRRWANTICSRFVSMGKRPDADTAWINTW